MTDLDGLIARLQERSIGYDLEAANNLKRMQTEISRLHERQASEGRHALRITVEVLRAQLARAMERMQHDEGCNAVTWPNKPTGSYACTCGLEILIKEVLHE